jgi:hypothetical protein
MEGSMTRDWVWLYSYFRMATPAGFGVRIIRPESIDGLRIIVYDRRLDDKTIQPAYRIERGLTDDELYGRDPLPVQVDTWLVQPRFAMAQYDIATVVIMRAHPRMIGRMARELRHELDLARATCDRNNKPLEARGWI